LQLESVSIVSNGSKIKEAWFEKYSKYLDILAISCDSSVETTNIEIGRGTGNHLEVVRVAPKAILIESRSGTQSDCARNMMSSSN
jgi:radical S-adenosyl methionine domain-containing protein 2